MKILTCKKCGKVVEVIKEGKGGLICCGEEMSEGSITEQQKSFQSVEEVLEFAMNKEEAAFAFYRDLARKVKTKGVDKLLLELADQEKEHKSFFLSLLKKKSSIKKFLKPQKIQDLKISDYVIEVSPSEDITVQEALIIAIKREKASFDFYTNLANSTTDAKLKKLFNAMAQEEAGHKLKLETIYDEVIYKEN
jgi:desulfoferrodoxin-like iron-binding protein